MKNEALFHRTVKILVDAYLNYTLLHGSCSACAVGNIIKANMGIPANASYERFWPYWDAVFMTCSGVQTIDLDEYEGMAKCQIDSTGYKVDELAAIEFAFETAPSKNYIHDDPEWMYNGLMAVVDTLCTIHEMKETTKQEAKALFVR